MILGIDLGTTNSAAAYMTPDGPRLIPNALGDTLTPSVVGLDGSGALLVGRAAKELSVAHPERCAAAFKRRMGDRWTCTLDGKEFSPEQLSSLVLTALRQDAEAHLGHAVNEAVITVPAYFNEHQRRATIEAGRMAGLKVHRILNEPTAASIAYGFHEAQQEKSLLVVDLGGGTFDVSVVEMYEGTVEVRASSGDSLLGGEDFTAAMAAKVLESQGYVYERAELQDPLLVARMRYLCERAKCQLSTAEHVTVRVPNRQGELLEGAPEVTVTRAEFESWTENILRRTEGPIRRALGDASLDEGRVDEVILVGGATRMPAFIARLEKLFGKPPQCRLNPDEVVALGAAVQAGLIAQSAALEDLVVTDVAPFTLGVETSKEFAGEHRNGYMLPIIHRNTTIPVSRVKRVFTVNPNQRQVRVAIYQGENRRVEHNILLAEFDLEGIPQGPAGQSIDIRFTYDLSGVLEVEAIVVATQRKARQVITRHARGLSEEEVARAVAAMQALKTTPREEAAYRLLLARAERIFRELPLDDRRHLERLLDGFEEALESCDRAAIAEFERVVSEFLNLRDWQQDEP